MNYTTEINSKGFVVIDNVYTDCEIDMIIKTIENSKKICQDPASITKTIDIFAIRKFHQEFPETLDLIFNQNLMNIIKLNFGADYFITKSIYFDKPEKSNWFVSYHQDLTIAVDKKIEIDNFINWTVKQKVFAVQPPAAILEKNFTVRIHLDKTTRNNGALKVLNKTHNKGIIRVENIEYDKVVETICEVEKGGIMIMKPLLFHASNKTTNNKRRRVLHIEFSNQILPEKLQWSEAFTI